MNNKKILMACLISCVSFIHSCTKATQTATEGTKATTTAAAKTVDVTISSDATYTYTLPSSSSYSISSESAHATANAINTSTSGDPIYKYVPATDFTGVDTVVVSGTDTTQMHGNCHHSDSTSTTSSKIEFHITVTAK